MWVAGQSGNPAGRPVGARGRFSQQFMMASRSLREWRACCCEYGRPSHFV